MQNDLDLQLMRLAGTGYCCSQIMLILGLEELGRSNPDLVRAAGGLCLGLGDCSGPCGVLTGGSCLLSLYAGKGLDNEMQDERLKVMLGQLKEWFAETARDEVGAAGISCREIIGKARSTPDPLICANLLAKTLFRVREILFANGFDPSQGRDI